METTSKDFKVIRGKYVDWARAARPLMIKHWKEVGMPGAENLMIDINDQVYFDLEQQNMLLCLGILNNQELIGYLTIVVFEHHQHQGHYFAQTDGFFVAPQYRGIKTFRAVCDMFKKAESILKQEFKVEYFTMNCNAVNDLKFLAECLDFTHSSTIYLKRL